MEPKKHQPYVSASQSMPEFTIKAILSGIAFGILFGAANAYLGLRAGLTISTSIPVAVMTVAVFRLLHKVGMQNTILEANTSQTIGSASSSVASGVIFTLPALFLWGMKPELIQMTCLAMFGGLLGVLFMIPLRRFLIEKEHGNLPYPEGTACAKVLEASEGKSGQARFVFWGLGLGALFKMVFGWFKVLPDKVKTIIPGLPNGEVGFNISGALFGVGYILGPRISTIMVSGSLLSSLIIIPAITIWGADRAAPLYPEVKLPIAKMSAYLIWTRYVRYIGAGAVATAGIITLIRSIPTMIESFRIGARQIKERMQGGGEQIPRTEKDLSLTFVGIGIAILAVAMTVVPYVFGPLASQLARITGAVLIVIFAFFFVTVSSRIVGMVGVTSNPTSGMTIATLLGTSIIFLMLGWTDDLGKATALTVGCVVAIAASIAGDTSQDLKTGYLLGATPYRQQIGEIIGVLTSATFVCLAVLLLAKAYTFGSEELPAPQANLMKLVIDGVLQQEIPWILVGIGVAIAIIAELLRIPSLPFAVGVYLPVTTMFTVFLGGLLRKVLEKKGDSEEAKESIKENGTLFGSGLVGGEGLMGVIIAGAAFWQGYGAKGKVEPWSLGMDWITESFANAAPIAGQLLSLAVFVALAFVFVRQCLYRENKGE